MRVWDIIVLLALAYTAIFVPVEVAFNAADWPWTPRGTRSYLGTAWPTPGSAREIRKYDPIPPWDAFLYVVDRMCDAIFMLDILLTFNLGVYDETMTIMEADRRVLARNYVGSYKFWLDVVSTIPYDLIVNSQPNDASLAPLKTLRVLKLLRMARAYRVVARVEEQSSLSVAHIRLVKYIAALLFLYHWLACGLQAVSGFENKPINWVSYVFNAKYGVPAADPLVMQPVASEVYTEALLWVIGHNPNVVVLQTNGEKAYAMCAFAITNILFAYIGAALFGLIMMMGKRTRAYDEAFDELNLFIQQRRVPPALSMRLRTYFRMQRPTSSDMGALDSWAQVLGSMPTVLRAEVVDAVGGGQEVTTVPYFRKLPPNLVLQLAMDLKYAAFPASEVLIRHGDDARAGSLMIVRKGVLIAHSPLSTSILPSTCMTVILGEEALWPGMGRVKATASALTRCEVHQVPVAHVRALLAAFPNEVVDSVMAEGRRRWMMSKIRILTTALRGVKKLMKASHHASGARRPNIIELLYAAEGHDSKDAVRAVAARRAGKGKDNSLFALAPEIAVMVLARAAPHEFETASNAATVVQRAYRSWRTKRKQRRVRDAVRISIASTTRALGVTRYLSKPRA